MEVSETKLEGVLLITPPTVFRDERGVHVELYNKRQYQSCGIDIEFVQDNISVSKQNVLRGIHGDYETWKLISCPHGTFYLVVVNWVEGSSQYRHWESFELSDQNRKQVLVPPSFGNGHYVLSQHAVFSYKQSSYYNRNAQFSIAWNDPDLAIDWPCNDPILSKRDAGLA